MVGRFNAMMMNMLKPTWNATTPFLDSLAAWEVECVSYTTQSSKQLDDSTRIAVVTACCPESVRWVVRMAALQHGSSYNAFKAHIELHLKQGLEYAGGFDSFGPSPMDVGGLAWKGGNGKGS